MTTCVKREDGWWIIGAWGGATECGPYKTRAEAEEDRRGLERSFRHRDDPKFWTTMKGNER